MDISDQERIAQLKVINQELAAKIRDKECELYKVSNDIQRLLQEVFDAKMEHAEFLHSRAGQVAVWLQRIKNLLTGAKDKQVEAPVNCSSEDTKSPVAGSCVHYLIIDSNFPTPDKDSASFRMMGILKVLVRKGCQVTFCAHNNLAEKSDIQRLEDLGVIAFQPSNCALIIEHLRQAGENYHAVMLCRADVASFYIDWVKKFATKAQVIFDTVDLHFLRKRRQAELEQNAKEFVQSEIDEAVELAICNKADAVLVVSEYEKKLIQGKVTKPVEVLSNIHETYPLNKPFAERKDILFIGSFRHLPNLDAVKYFITEIFPLIKETLPNIKLHVIGDNASDELLSLANDSVVFHGYVPEIERVFDSCKLSIAPLRFGAGVKGKVNQSMSRGVPVVCTSIAAEGMFLENGVNALIADTPTAFAQAVISLYGDEELWQRLSAQGYQNVKEHFGYLAAEAAFSRINCGG